jgi:hypothetical protein
MFIRQSERNIAHRKFDSDAREAYHAVRCTRVGVICMIHLDMDVPQGLVTTLTLLHRSWLESFMLALSPWGSIALY